jgi:hypothetical protein
MESKIKQRKVDYSSKTEQRKVNGNQNTATWSEIEQRLVK